MSKVHTYSLITELYSDTRIPLQFLGNSQSPAPRQFELSVLLEFLNSNITFPDGPLTVTSATITGASNSVVIPAGRMLSKIVVISAGHDDFDLGTTDGGTEVIEAGVSSSSGEVYLIDTYFGSGGTVYFTGMAGTLTVKVILINLT